MFIKKTSWYYKIILFKFYKKTNDTERYRRLFVYNMYSLAWRNVSLHQIKYLERILVLGSRTVLYENYKKR